MSDVEKRGAGEREGGLSVEGERGGEKEGDRDSERGRKRDRETKRETKRYSVMA